MKEQTYLIMDGGRSHGPFERTTKEVFEETIQSYVNGSGPDVPEDEMIEGEELSEDFLFVFKGLAGRFIGMEDSSMVWISGSLTNAELIELFDMMDSEWFMNHCY